MTYLLDTDTLSYLINKKSPNHSNVLTNLQLQLPSEVFISFFTQCELYYGLERVDNRKKQYKMKLEHAIKLLVDRINIMPIPRDVYKLYGKVRAKLVMQGQDIGVMDCMISSLAIATKSVLVTHNTKHYQRIQTIPNLGKLILTDWT